MSIKSELMKKFEDHSANIFILGLGYVGLPLAVVFAKAGFNVTGIDPIQEKVDLLNQGKSYILDVDDQQLSSLIKNNKLRASTDFSLLKSADAVSICVPTPLRKTGDPDLSFIVSATEIIITIYASGNGYRFRIQYIPRYYT